MDIRCERCGTEYEIDDARVTDAGVSVKCSTCELVFTVRPGAVTTPAAGFQIRRDGQPLASCPDLATAQRWVSERRLLRSDELERNGTRTRLGEVPELLPFFALVDAAQRTPSPTSAPRFTAPLFTTNPAIPMPPPEAPAAPDFRSTMQFHTPSDPSQVGTEQLFIGDLKQPRVATTQQFLVTKPADTSSDAATELALPALTLPSASKPPAVTMQFRVPVEETPPDKAKTEAMLLPTPLQPQGVLPEDVDALETLQFKVPTGPIRAEPLTGAPLLSAPAGARTRAEGATPPTPLPVTPTSDTTREASIPSADRTPAVATPIPTREPAPTTRLPAVEPAWATGSTAAADDEEDPEILAFQKRGRGGRVALVLVLVAAVVAAVGWFVVKPMLEAPPPPAPGEAVEKAPPPPAEEAAVTPPAEPPAPKQPEPAKKPEPAPTAKAEPKKQPEKTVRKTEPAVATKAAPKPVIAPAPVEPGLFDDLPPPPAAVDVDALIAQGNQWLKRGQPAKALEYFDQAVAERPSNAEAVYLRGVARFDLGRTDDSIVDLERALKISPRFAAAMIVLADAWKTKGNVAQARTWYQKYLDLAPDGSDAAAARANLARLK